MRMRRPPKGTEMRRPPRRRTPTGTPKPAGTFQRLGLTRAELQKQKLTATPARPTATPRRAPIGTPTATPFIPPRRKPTGTPSRRQPTAAQKAMLEKAFKKLQPPTSAQRAAMRKQAIASRGNTATVIKRQDETIRRAVRQGEISKGQARSLKMARQRPRPRRRPTGTPRRRMI